MIDPQEGMREDIVEVQGRIIQEIERGTEIDMEEGKTITEGIGDSFEVTQGIIL